ncbi:hypothetical protein IWW47_001748 [Coemansia sp. RSA 2052]|nr:hypothetical protein IWW47_001748 [Coemansia sp. RSA 2052]
MRPDPHKQKASRRYQAKHRVAANVETPGTASQGKPADDSSKIENDIYGENTLDTNDDAEARDEEDIREFLNYLKDESQRVTAEQSTVYFQLRAETESAELGAHSEGMWQKLLDVDWDGSLKSITTSTTLQELLDSDHEFAPTDETRQEGDIASQEDATAQPAQLRGIVRHLDAVELAPNAKPATKQPAITPSSTVKKQEKTQPADDLEAFLDDLL